MIILKFLFVILGCLINKISSIDTDLWAYVISTSHTFENFRHSINSLMMYNFLKKNGIPDERIIAGLSEFHACSPYNFYPGKLHLTDNGQIITSCHSDVHIDYKEADFHNFQLIDILKGRSSNMISNFRKLKSDKNSRIVMIITAHGGENFIKVRGRSVILSDELNRALNEMHIKGRYKEILFILDTCEGLSLFDYVDVPNVYFITSSEKDQKAHSYLYDLLLMSPTSDRFHFKLHEYLQQTYKRKSFGQSLHEMFLTLKRERKFIESDVSIRNNINREIIFEEFFGNYLKKNNLNTKYKFSIQNNTEAFEGKDEVNQELRIIKNKTDNEVLNLKKYSQHDYTFSDTNLISFEGQIPINTLFLLLLVYLIYNLIKI